MNTEISTISDIFSRKKRGSTKITESIKTVKRQDNNFPRRYFIPKVTPQATLNLQFTKLNHAAASMKNWQ